MFNQNVISSLCSWRDWYLPGAKLWQMNCKAVQRMERRRFEYSCTFCTRFLQQGQNSCTWKINSGSYARYLIRGSIYWFIWIKNSNSSQMRGNSLLKSIQLEITKKPPLALLFYRNLDERHCLFVNLAFFLVSQQSTRSFTTHQPDLFTNWGQMRNSPSYHVHVKLIITQDCSEHYKLFVIIIITISIALISWAHGPLQCIKENRKIICIEHEINYIKIFFTTHEEEEKGQIYKN